MIRCPNCSKKMKAKTLPEYDAGDLLGLRSVIVRKMPAFVCPKCDEVVIAGDMLDGISKRIVHDLLVGSFPLGGVEIRFLRKTARLTQDGLAKLLGVDRATVNRWENGGKAEPVPATASPVVRMVILASGHAPGVELPTENFRHPPAERPSRLSIEAPAIAACG